MTRRASRSTGKRRMKTRSCEAWRSCTTANQGPRGKRKFEEPDRSTLTGLEKGGGNGRQASGVRPYIAYHFRNHSGKRRKGTHLKHLGLGPGADLEHQRGGGRKKSLHHRGDRPTPPAPPTLGRRKRRHRKEPGIPCRDLVQLMLTHERRGKKRFSPALNPSWRQEDPCERKFPDGLREQPGQERRLLLPLRSVRRGKRKKRAWAAQTC